MACRFISGGPEGPGNRKGDSECAKEGRTCDMASTFGEVAFDGTTPLYQQLYTHLRSSILAGRLKNGTRLPSTRGLAEELNISRNTVLTAYQQLLAEGYLESTGGSGTFVARILPDLSFEPPKHAIPAGPARKARGRLPFSNQARQQLASAETADALPRSRKEPRPFRAELPALDAFPHELWSRLLIRRARHLPSNAFTYQDSAGYRPLREAIAAHVTVSRQVHCTADQIMIVSGSQGALDLASRMLINAGDEVWLEDPGYPGACGAFNGVGARIIPVPVDEEGLDVDTGKRLGADARVVYVTPSHQFPLGVTMSLRRRLELLRWAQRADAYVLEDDYDSEYRFAGRPLAALQGLDTSDRVIYIGTFSKVLFPGLRLGYLILPPALVDSFLTVRRLIDIHAPVFEQAVLADFIMEGHFQRHLRRMRTLYAERRSTLLRALVETGLDIQVDSSQAGIHCVGWLPPQVDDQALAHRAAERGIHLTPIADLAIRRPAPRGLLLGYGGFTSRQIRAAVRELAEIMRAF